MSKARVGADGLVCPVERSSVPRRGHPRRTAWLRHAAAILLSAAREIFDESAYARFLRRTQMASSPDAYAAFRQEHEALKARRPRCC